MGLCVVLQADGTLAPSGQAVGECTGYVLATPGEVVFSEVIASVFAAPDPAVAAGWFAGVFALIVTTFLAARAVGAVVNSVR